MEKLYWLAVTVIIGWCMLKVAFVWGFSKIKFKSPNANVRMTDYTRSKFNYLLKGRKLFLADILAIDKILSKYTEGRKYKNSCHKIYSVLKHCKVSQKDMAQVQLILETAQARKKSKKTLAPS